MTSAVAPPRTPRAPRKPRDPNADVTLRVDPREHARLTLFVKALERHYFIQDRRMERVSQSEAIQVLLDQPWAREIMSEFELLADRNRDKL